MFSARSSFHLLVYSQCQMQIDDNEILKMLDVKGNCMQVNSVTLVCPHVFS